MASLTPIAPYHSSKMPALWGAKSIARHFATMHQIIKVARSVVYMYEPIPGGPVFKAREDEMGNDAQTGQVDLPERETMEFDVVIVGAGRPGFPPRSA